MQSTFRITLLFLFFVSIFSLNAQLDQPPFTPAVERDAAYQVRKQVAPTSLLKNIAFRQLGPVVQSGRVVDVAVNPADPTEFYAAFASGGLWKTENNGISFSPLFQNEAVMTIGAIAVDWTNNTIWLGTGEVNSSRSSYAGAGIYKSTDGGKTFQQSGLAESHHIGRIILHPNDPNIAWVAALGHLYSPNQERGVYKTTDGGKTWKKTLFVDQNAGAVELTLDPNNNNILYAAMWERTRRAWNFVESGIHSGIYKSTDQGDHWTLMTDKNSGFPTGKGVGRIGLASVSDRNKTILYAAVDNYNRRPKKEPSTFTLTKDELRQMDKNAFLKIEDYKIKDYLRQNNFPEKYDLDAIKKMIKNDKITPNDLVKYTENANALLFDTPVIGLEIYRSEDNGKTWHKTHENYLDGVYYSYGYYFGQIRSNPRNPKEIYVYGVPILKSLDSGKTFEFIGGDNVHVDHHALWVDPNKDGHLILGNDGGINISYDDGENWIKCNTPPVAQAYAIAVDMEEPFNVFCGLQDNGVWKGPSTDKISTSWHNSGHYSFDGILGGDGMQIAVDTRDNNTVYTGFQFGNYYRIDLKEEDYTYITPKHDLGESPYRWNWQAPIILSPHAQDIVYFGANKLFRSLDKGNHFEAISGDLTNGGKKGDVAYGTITAIDESPLKFGLIYTGSDDGKVYCSPDGGNTWKDISVGLPENYWVSRIQASKFEAARVYVSLNGYRWDHFNSMVYVSEDYGQTWTKIGKQLPLEPVNVIREDPQNPDILYVGTDNGLYVSLDRGTNFMEMNKQLPAVAIHDLIVHPRDHQLVVGTHGRSLFIADVTALQQLTPELMAKKLHLFDIGKGKSRANYGKQSWFSKNEASFEFPIYVSQKGDVSIEIQTEKGIVLYRNKTMADPGINYLTYDLTIDDKQIKAYQKELNELREDGSKPIRLKKADNGKFYIQKGKYQIILRKDGEEVKEEWVVK